MYYTDIKQRSDKSKTSNYLKTHALKFETIILKIS